MPGTPFLSIIVVSYSTAAVLRDCLLSIRSAVDIHHETIVVDNASPDGSADMVASEFPEVVLLRNTENLGFSPANNIGMQRARGRYIVLLNPDTLVTADSINSWLVAHQRLNATISGPRLLDKNGRPQVSAWRIPGLFDAVLELFMLHKMIAPRDLQKGGGAKEFETEFVSGAAMLFESTLLKQHVGLDPEMFWMEDADLCYRIREAGGTCWYVNGPGIIHIGGESSKRNLDRVISNQLLSRIKFARKHAPAWNAFCITLTISAHAFTRAVAFSLISAVKHEPRATAYRHTISRLWRYLFKGDRSI